jgi:hypothetical protein
VLDGGKLDGGVRRWFVEKELSRRKEKGWRVLKWSCAVFKFTCHSEIYILYQNIARKNISNDIENNDCVLVKNEINRLI